MIKKLIKFIKIICYTTLCLIVLGVGALYFFFLSGKIIEIAKNYVKENYNREIYLENVSMAIVGVNINKFKISEVGTFEKNGTFVEAEDATIKLEFLPLLEGKVRIKKLLLEGVKINIIKGVNGKFNFDNFITSKTEEQTQESSEQNESSSDVSLFAENINLRNSSFHYEDKKTKMKFDIDNLNIGIQDFSLNNVFPFNLDLQTSLDMDDIKLTPVFITLQGKADLANFKMDNAYVDIDPLTLSYKEAKMIFKGQIKNFTDLHSNLEGKIEGINNEVIKSIMPIDLPVFALPSANLVVNANMDSNTSKINITKADILLGNSYIKNKAKVDFSRPNLIYDVKTNFSLFLTDIYNSAKEMLKEIVPQGTISGNIQAVSTKLEPTVKGKISLKNLGAIIVHKQLKDFNGEITINSIKDIKTNIMNGSYDGHKFVTSLAYNQPLKPINIDFMLDLDKFTLDDINFDELLNSSSEPLQENTKQEPQKQENKNSNPNIYNIKVNAKVKEVANNVLTAKNLSLQTDLKNFTNDLSKLQGSLSFTSENGEIRDINKLMNSSKIMKAIFSVLKVVQHVFSIAKLENITIGDNNKITYSQIEGVYTIKDGLINLDKSTIVSNLLTVKASGTINLVSEKLNMKVNTHFGKVTEGSGFRPVVLKITGTMNEPKYSVDVLSTVTSIANVPANILKGGVNLSTNTASGVSDGLKKIVSTIGKLF